MGNHQDLSFLDQLMISQVVFHPRKARVPDADTEDKFSICFDIQHDISICGRFHKTPKAQRAPNLLFFHGNGEIAYDYDDFGPIYQQKGINFCVMDYRGYGESTGIPSFSTMLSDSHVIYKEYRKYLEENNYAGPISIMGRSLGSASAIEIAYSYQKELASLIVESGFAYTYELLNRLGVPSHLLPKEKEMEVSTIPLIEEINIPTLIIHGESDDIIPLHNGQALFDHSPNLEKKLLIISEAGHNDLLLRGFKEYMNAVEAIIHK